MVTAAGTQAPLSMLRDRLHQAMRRATTRRGTTLVSASVSVPALDPLELFARAQAVERDRVYWERPASGAAITGLGVAWSGEGLEPAGAARAWHVLLDGACIDDAAPRRSRSYQPAEALSGPLLLGGFAFDPSTPTTGLWDGYGKGRLVLPYFTVVTAGVTSILTINSVIGMDPESEVASGRLLDWAEDALTGREAAYFCRGVFQASSSQQRRLYDAPAAPCAIMLRDDGETAGHEPVAGSRPDAGCYGLLHESLLSREAWESIVADAAHACRRGELEKVVLARAVRAWTDNGAPIDTVRTLRRLRDSYPHAYVFALAHGDSCFLGATPERLVRLRDGVSGTRVSVACLAGSAPRGATPAEDERRGHALLASSKDRAEHAIVVRAVRSALEGACADVHVPAQPRLLRLPNVQHLYTPVTGRLSDSADVLDLVSRLHPTPAVGGYPREPALRYIRSHEKLDRGLYAGPVGWLDRHGDGEFAVALRSACVRGGEAMLFAGCGIVAGSNPAAEYDETLLKLQPMLTALRGDYRRDRERVWNRARDIIPGDRLEGDGYGARRR